MGTELDGGDPDQSKNDWGKLVLPSPPRNIPTSPSNYSCMVDLEIRVCVLVGNFNTLRTSIRTPSDFTKERGLFLSEFQMMLPLKLFLLPHSRLHQVQIIYQHPLQSSLVKSQISKDSRQ